MSGVIGEPLPASAGQRQRWRERMTSLQFDPEANFVAPARSRTNPLVAIRARLAILLATYRDDYHTDSFDLDRLRLRVERGEEGIAFWGPASSVARLQDWLEREAAVPSDRELEALELGTATLIDAGEEFGPGHWELCRGGSVSRTVSSAGATLSSLLRFFDASGSADGFHTIVSVVRNRRSEPGVAGGAAIHRLYTREIGSSFWGFAPWYVMQGGLLELLDYREVYRDSDAVRVAIGSQETVAVSDPEEAALVADLIELNLGPGRLLPPIEIGEPSEPASSAWRLHGSEQGGLIGFNHVSARPVDSAGPSLGELLDTHPARAAACVAARVPLSAAHLADQAALRRRGFRLTAVSPPKDTAPGAAFAGLWSRPRAGLGLAQPYYFDSGLLDPIESRIVAHFQKAVRKWRRSDLAVAG